MYTQNYTTTENTLGKVTLNAGAIVNFPTVLKLADLTVTDSIPLYRVSLHCTKAAEVTGIKWGEQIPSEKGDIDNYLLKIRLNVSIAQKKK